MNGSDVKKAAATTINNSASANNASAKPKPQPAPGSPGQAPPSSNGNKKRRKGANDLKPIITADRKSHDGSPASSVNSMNHS
jgi:hypothetical protein